MTRSDSMTRGSSRAIAAAAIVGLGACLVAWGDEATRRVPVKFDLAGAIASAEAGTEIVVPAGVYEGPVVVDRPVRLVASAGVILDGGGEGDVVRITAPDVTLRGFVIRGTGVSVDRENAGIAAVAPRATIEGNRLEDVLFGVVLSESPGSVIRGNLIVGKDLELGRRGDAIRVWQSAGTVVERNTVRHSRDVVVWYSTGTVLRENAVTDSRYGLHAMYTDRCTFEDNRLEGNSVGIFMMYSRDLEARRNVIVNNRGPSGFGVGLKDVDGAALDDNLIAGNRVGINLDTSPVRSDLHHTHRGNVIAFNDVGVAFMPNVRNNHFHGNALVENIESVAIMGGGAFEGQNTFTVDGRGNYWSDYRGFDLDGDGVGDVAHRDEGLFENLMDREAKLRYFLYSPAQQAIDMAARSFPVVRPRPKLVDERPSMRVEISEGLASVLPAARGGGVGHALAGGIMGLLGLGVVVGGSLGLRLAGDERSGR